MNIGWKVNMPESHPDAQLANEVQTGVNLVRGTIYGTAVAVSPQLRNARSW